MPNQIRYSVSIFNRSAMDRLQLILLSRSRAWYVAPLFFKVKYQTVLSYLLICCFSSKMPVTHVCFTCSRTSPVLSRHLLIDIGWSQSQIRSAWLTSAAANHWPGMFSQWTVLILWVIGGICVKLALIWRVIGDTHTKKMSSLKSGEQLNCSLLSAATVFELWGHWNTPDNTVVSW